MIDVDDLFRNSLSNRMQHFGVFDSISCTDKDLNFKKEGMWILIIFAIHSIFIYNYTCFHIIFILFSFFRFSYEQSIQKVHYLYAFMSQIVHIYPKYLIFSSLVHEHISCVRLICACNKTMISKRHAIKFTIILIHMHTKLVRMIRLWSFYEAW